MPLWMICEFVNERVTIFIDYDQIGCSTTESLSGGAGASSSWMVNCWCSESQ